MSPIVRPTALTISATIALALAAAPLAAQSNAAWNPLEILKTETYVRPPSDVEKMILTPRTDISFSSPSPDKKWFLRTTSMDRGDIQDYGKPHIYLGGLQVDTKANRARSLTTSTRHGLSLVDPHTGITRALDTPKGASISAQTWSPSGASVAYIANFDEASYVYVADVASGKSVQISKAPLLATLHTAIEWTADGKSIIALIVPDGRGPLPTHGKNGVEDGPQVRLTNAKALPQAVHASLLEDPHDKALLKYFSTGQLVVLDVKTKAVRKIGAPKMIRAVDASADGQYFRVTQMTEPFSYIVPTSNFGSVQELWDATGKVIATLNTTPLREGALPDGVDVPPAGGRGGAAATAADTGKRNMQWNPVGPGLVYLQSIFATNATTPSTPTTPAVSGAASGRGGRGAGARAARAQPTSVRYMNWLPPFGPTDMKMLYEGGPELGTIAFSADTKTMFVSDSGMVIAMHTAAPTKRYNLGKSVTLPAVGVGGRGGNGGLGGATNDTASTGALAMTRGPNGQHFVIIGSDGKTVALSGSRAPGAKWSTQAPRPWLDKLDIETGTRSRVFESPVDAFDEFVAPLNNDYTQFIYTHESPTVITDAYLRDVTAGTSKKLTSNVDIGPGVSHAIVKRFQVERPRDGLKMWVDVTLPRDWKPGTKLPGIIWFYPREFTSQSEYDRSRFTTNINKFPEVPSTRPASSTKIWVSQGYALIEPDIPIFGDTGKMNDHYTRDLKENLDAVLDAVVDSGFVSRDKMGIGGHSYGAFSTVNALTLTPYFKAGIAGDGMYNRSLTPFGFQSERRNFFQAQDTYLDMSPFFRADKIAGALLMYHATEDQNQGTAPISSIRMMQALQGLGKPAALYMYPYEDHSVATYQSDLDLWARWLAWFDVYVKNPRSDMKALVP